MDEKKKRKVLDLLSKNRDGLTVIEISKLLDVSRNTCSVILANLDGAGLIRVREVGKCKLHYLKEEDR
jgi:Mn-dependent DtxR family transcriptional regulator